MDSDLSVRDPRDSLAEPLETSPADELALADLKFHAAELDEDETMWDPDTHPKVPHLKEEATTDRDGLRTVDMQRDTPRVDDLADFDLSTEELSDVDL